MPIKSNELSAVLDELGSKIINRIGGAEELITAIPGLALYRMNAPTAPNSCNYAPSILVIPQGRKRVTLGSTHYVFGQSQFLLTSIELPIVSQVVTASREKPYLAFFLKLDMSMVREILRTEDGFTRIKRRSWTSPPIPYACIVFGSRPTSRGCSWRHVSSGNATKKKAPA